MKSNQNSQLETVAQRRARDADELVMAAKAGDPAAFDRLVRRFRPRIYALALHLSGSASDADDITQDAFVQAYRRLPQFEGRSQFFTWLYRIAVRRSIDAERERKRTGPFLEDARVEVALQIDAHGDPGRAVQLRQTYTALLGALDSLSPSLKSAVVLTALQGLSYQEAAVVLGTTEGAIGVRIHEARKQLRAHLERAATPLKARAQPLARGVQQVTASRERRAPTAPGLLEQDLAVALAALL
jgi:RNA polymerase sigma-70 factor (ECF subfamily)